MTDEEYLKKVAAQMTKEEIAADIVATKSGRWREILKEEIKPKSKIGFHNV